jgi:hypothetical protein
MRLTVGPLPAAVYWRRRAAVALALALVAVAILVAMIGIGRDGSTPTAQPTSPGGPRTSGHTSSTSGAPGTTSAVGIGSSGPDASISAGPATSGGSGSGSGGSGSGGSGTGGSGSGGSDSGGSGSGGNGAPPVVATVACTDAEISLTVAVSPSPGVYGGIITLTLSVRNTATHACLRDVGSAQQELQVRQGETVLWSSDHCDPGQGVDVRAFGPNIESQFWRSWNPYRVAPHECDPPADAVPAGVGTYQVVARLGTRVSEPVTFEIRR